MKRERTSSWSRTSALGPARACALILRGARLNEDGTWTLVCAWCEREGLGREVQLDHLVPREHGGLDTDDNLVPCCPLCNLTRPLRVPARVRAQARAPLTRELRRAGDALACGWYDWHAERKRKNVVKQRARDALKRADREARRREALARERAKRKKGGKRA